MILCDTCEKSKTCVYYNYYCQDGVLECTDYVKQRVINVCALNSIADRMEEMAGLGAALTPDGLEKMAKRIRKALGEE